MHFLAVVKKRILARWILFSLMWISFSMAETVTAEDGVVLLHGLSRTSGSMKGMERYLESEGFLCLNVGYKSRSSSIEELASYVREAVLEGTKDWERIHFVTHSMGGIVLRQIQRSEPLSRLGRVVMLAPPNQGSEVVDRIGETWCFKAWNGPAGCQLGTANDGFVASLGPVDFELGVIAGSRKSRSLFDGCFEGEHDGKVAVERARVEGMKEFLVVTSGHTFIMGKHEVRKATLCFLKSGRFE